VAATEVDSSRPARASTAAMSERGRLPGVLPVIDQSTDSVDPRVREVNTNGDDTCPLFRRACDPEYDR
jgi:hypothetical protein